MASAKPGAGGESKTYEKAESDFSRSVKSLPLSAADGGYDAGKVAKQRAARIAKQGRGPLFNDYGSRQYPRKVLKTWAVRGGAASAEDRKLVADAADIEIRESAPPRIPGYVTWGTLNWTLVGATSQGCRSELLRASDDVGVEQRQSSSTGSCDAVYSTFDGDNIRADARYYVRLYNLIDGRWTLMFNGKGSAFGERTTVYTPGFLDGLAIGLCKCWSTTGILGQFILLVGDPVSTATGAFSDRVQDLKMAAPGIAFDLTRVYSSSDTTTGLLGRGWTFPYEASLAIASDKVTYRAEDGQRVEYKKNTDGSFTGPEGVTSKLAAISGGYRLSTKTHVTLTFDTTGKLTSWKDPSGQGLTFAYDADGLASITDAAGRVVTVDVVAGRVEQVTLPDGRYVAYRYTNGMLTSVRDVRGGTTLYSYTTAGLLDTVTDQKTRVILDNTYDTQGRITAQQTPDGPVSYQYDIPSKGDTTYTDARGGKWTYAYRGNVLMQSIDPLGNITDYAYNQKLQLVTVTDPKDLTTWMSYDAAGNMVRRASPAPLSYVERWEYDAADNLRFHTDKRGKVTEYRYTAANLVEDIIDPINGEAKPTHFTYNARGQVKTETTPGGRVTTHEYDSQGNRIWTETELGNRTTFTYDDTGRLRTQIDPRGTATIDVPGDYTTTYGYDAADHVTLVTDARGNTTRFEFDAVGDQTAVIDPFNKRTTQTYDAMHRPLNRTEPNGVLSRQLWDASGNRRSVVDGTGAFTRYVWDPANRLDFMVSPRGMVEDGNQAAYTWDYTSDANGNQIQVKDPLGHVTKTDYDQVNRPIVVTDPLLHKTTTEYDGNDNVTKVTDALNNATQTGYDDLNRKATSTDARNNVTTYGYDEDGNLTSVTAPSLAKTTYGYDQDGQQTSMVDARGNVTGVDPNLYKSTYGYDVAGNQTSVKDPLGNETVTDYDPVNNITRVLDANNHATRWEYDEKNRLKKVIGPDSTNDTGVVYGYDDVDNLTSRLAPGETAGTTYGYDAVGRVIETVDPLGRKTTHRYDPDGNQDQTITARGWANPTADNLAKYTIGGSYDARNLRTALASPDTGLNATYSYDEAARQKTAVGWGGTITFSYYDNNWLKTYGRGTAQFTYDYDADGHVTSRTYPDSTIVTATYDTDGRQWTSTRSGQTATFRYFENNALRSITLPSGSALTESRAYDRAGRLTVATTLKGSTRVNRFDVTPDKVGNPAKVATSRGTDPASYEYFSYDDANRITGACYSANNTACQAGDPTIAYDYDLSGNRTMESRTGVANPGLTTYDHDPADQLIKSTKDGTDTTYGYDADGNQTTAGTTSYDYDAANRLRGRYVNGTKTNTLTYDALSNRLGVTGTGNTQAFTWDINADLPMLAGVTEGTNTLTWRYHDDGTPLEVIAGTTTTPSTGANWLHHDWHGSITDTSNPTGVAQTRTSYEPYGTPTTTNLDPAALDTRLGYTGEYHDPRLGLIHLRARDYNPTLGEFTAKDPLAPAFDDPYVSTYAYANNRPTVFVDPSGKIGVCEGPEGCSGLGGPGGGYGGGVWGTSGYQWGKWGRAFANVLRPPGDPEAMVFFGMIFRSAKGQKAPAYGVNKVGCAYPVVKDPRTGEPIPYPGAGLKRMDKEKRVSWDKRDRYAYIKEWHDRGYPTPPGGWAKYDIHHIRPREYGGQNDFWNLVPVDRTIHQTQFNRYWEKY